LSKRKAKTIIKWDSLVATHPTMNQRAYSFITVEWMDSPVSYVLLGC